LAETAPIPDVPARGPGDHGALREGRAWRAVRAGGSRVRLNLEDPVRMLPVVLIVAFVVRAIWLDLPGRSLIFDEAYYVNAARVLLGWPVPAGAHYAGSPAGLDPNTEHPPLGKLLMAGSMLLLGDNGFGWRLPSLIAGMIALVATWAIARTSGATARLSVLVVTLLAFDNLTFVHGRIGTLDMMVLAAILVGSWLALKRRWALAGLAMAVGILIKLTAIYGVVAVLLLYLLLEGARLWRARRIPLADLRGPVVFVVVFLVAGLAGLWALDQRFTTFATPLDHLRRMVEYGANLGAPKAQVGFCPGADSRPWQWPFNECQIQYLRVDVTVRAGDKVISSTPKIDFRGAINPLLTGTIVLAGLFTVWFAWRRQHRLALWAVAWAAANYLPYIALGLFTNRIMYIYYFLPALPAVAAAVALLLARSGLPRFVLWGFLIAYFAGFVAYFPFRQIP
jgi:4-amino-4-deoxy-L-arabinose transferase-like glycosyltransferase